MKGALQALHVAGWMDGWLVGGCSDRWIRLSVERSEEVIPDARGQRQRWWDRRDTVSGAAGAAREVGLRLERRVGRGKGKAGGLSCGCARTWTRKGCRVRGAAISGIGKRGGQRVAGQAKCRPRHGNRDAVLAQLVERKALNLVVQGSSPWGGG